MQGILEEHIRPGHANAHGTRKGSAVEATSGTTCPPPPSSVARRGEWSMGKIFDIYWLFAQAGDQYLGRILAGLDPNTPEFATLPPHFKEGIENENIVYGMKRCFPSIMTLNDEETRKNMTGLLMRCLASIVWHSEVLLKVIAENPGHPFYLIPVLNETNLLCALRPLVTTDPTRNMSTPTGIPPHCKMMVDLKALMEMLTLQRKDHMDMKQDLIMAVRESIEQHAIENGHLTHSSVTSILNQQNEAQKRRIDEVFLNRDRDIDIKLNSILSALRTDRAPPLHDNLPSFEENNVNDGVRTRSFLHSWGGKFWHVPENFMFPAKCNRKRAWELWILGQPNYVLADGTSAPVMPFMKLDPKLMPKKRASKLKLEWRPVLSVMSKAPGLPVIDVVSVSMDIIELSYSIATEYLKTHICSYVWQKYERHNGWAVSTWCKRVQYKSIMAEGTDSDKANLPPPTFRNSKRKVVVDEEDENN